MSTSIERGIIKNSEIAQLQDPIADIASQILSSGKSYCMILGDDTSGRIPTLILGKVLNEVRSTRGEGPLPIRFTYGESSALERELADILDRLKEINPRRVLLITEYVEFGFSLDKIISFLSEKKIICDLAAVFN